MLDGCWSYVLPEHRRGGNLCVKDGIVAGGNGSATFDGVVIGTTTTVQMVLVAKHLPNCRPNPWGDAPAKYVVAFRGERDGSIVRGCFERSEFPDQRLNAVMTYEGPAP
jgi:hypothetical protein